MENNIIPEGSSVKVFLGDEIVAKIINTDSDIKVFKDALIMINGQLMCTSRRRPLVKISENEYQINVFLQDAMVIQNGNFYYSVNEL